LRLSIGAAGAGGVSGLVLGGRPRGRLTGSLPGFLVGRTVAVLVKRDFLAVFMEEV